MYVEDVTPTEQFLLVLPCPQDTTAKKSKGGIVLPEGSVQTPNVGITFEDGEPVGAVLYQSWSGNTPVYLEYKGEEREFLLLDKTASLAELSMRATSEIGAEVL